jgi:hypothetical protein
LRGGAKAKAYQYLIKGGELEMKPRPRVPTNNETFYCPGGEREGERVEAGHSADPAERKLFPLAGGKGEISFLGPEAPQSIARL